MFSSYSSIIMSGVRSKNNKILQTDGMFILCIAFYNCCVWMLGLCDGIKMVGAPNPATTTGHRFCCNNIPLDIINLINGCPLISEPRRHNHLLNIHQPPLQLLHHHLTNFTSTNTLLW